LSILTILGYLSKGSILGPLFNFQCWFERIYG
jgi:hypothetical protein